MLLSLTAAKMTSSHLISCQRSSSFCGKTSTAVSLYSIYHLSPGQFRHCLVLKCPSTIIVNRELTLSFSSTQALVQTYLKPGPPVQLDVNAADDPRDAYCSVIFKSNCFNLEALRKTICVLDPQLSPLVNDGSVTDLQIGRAHV